MSKDNLRAHYLSLCQEHKCKPNSDILAVLPDAPATVSCFKTLDLSDNFVGKNGVLCLLPVVRAATYLTTLSLRDNYIDNETVSKLCAALESHPSLTRLDLSRNQISHAGGKEISALVTRNPRLISVEVEHTYINKALVKIIHRKASENETKYASTMTTKTDETIQPHQEHHQPPLATASLATSSNNAEEQSATGVDNTNNHKHDDISIHNKVNDDDTDQNDVNGPPEEEVGTPVSLLRNGGAYIGAVLALVRPPASAVGPPRASAVFSTGTLSTPLTRSEVRASYTSLTNVATVPMPHIEGVAAALHEGNQSQRGSLTSVPNSSKPTTPKGSRRARTRSTTPQSTKQSAVAVVPVHINYLFILAQENEAAVPGLRAMWAAAYEDPQFQGVKTPPASRQAQSSSTAPLNPDAIRAHTPPPTVPRLDGPQKCGTPVLPPTSSSSGAALRKGSESAMRSSGQQTACSSLDAVLSSLPLDSAGTDETNPFTALRTLQSAIRKSQENTASLSSSAAASASSPQLPQHAAAASSPSPNLSVAVPTSSPPAPPLISTEHNNSTLSLSSGMASPSRLHAVLNVALQEPEESTAASPTLSSSPHQQYPMLAMACEQMSDTHNDNNT
eukprot:PhM_4_TR16408/c0_g1_i1/m.87530